MAFGYNSIIDHAVLYIGPSQPAIFNTLLREVIYDFLNRSQAVTEEYTIDSVDGQAAYDFTTAAGSNGLDIYKIWYVKYRENKLLRTDYTFTRPGVITLKNTPTEDDIPISVKAVWTTKTEAGAAVLPDFIEDMYAEAIAKGVLAKMCKIPGKPYTSIEASNMYYREYKEAINDALYHVNRNRNIRGISGKYSDPRF